jgi:hypothetical protein
MYLTGTHPLLHIISESPLTNELTDVGETSSPRVELATSGLLLYIHVIRIDRTRVYSCHLDCRVIGDGCADDVIYCVFQSSLPHRLLLRFLLPFLFGSMASHRRYCIITPLSHYTHETACV